MIPPLRLISGRSNPQITCSALPLIVMLPELVAELMQVGVATREPFLDHLSEHASHGQRALFIPSAARQVIRGRLVGVVGGFVKQFGASECLSRHARSPLIENSEIELPGRRFHRRPCKQESCTGNLRPACVGTNYWATQRRAVMKKHLVWLVAVPLLAGCDLDLDGLGGCTYDEDFSDAISASGMTALRVLADDGNLEVIGRPGLSQVRVYATACSSSSRTVDDIDFVLYRNGDIVEVETNVPRIDNAHLNLTIEIPETMAAALYHEAGNIDVRDIDVLYIDDESGHIEVRNIFFDVEIVDGSGDIDIFSVNGDVEIDDGSGDIDVDDIGGDFRVFYDGSGSIRYRNVRGIVDIP